MLVLLFMLILVRWRVSLDARRDAIMARVDVPMLDARGNEVPAAGGGILRVPDAEKRAFLDEEALHAKWARRALRALGVLVVLWCLVLASYIGSEGALEGAEAMLARCDSKTTDVQSCTQPAISAYLDASGQSAQMRALVWILAVL